LAPKKTATNVLAPNNTATNTAVEQSPSPKLRLAPNVLAPKNTSTTAFEQSSSPSNTRPNTTAKNTALGQSSSPSRSNTQNNSATERKPPLANGSCGKTASAIGLNIVRHAKQFTATKTGFEQSSSASETWPSGHNVPTTHKMSATKQKQPSATKAKAGSCAKGSSAIGSSNQGGLMPPQKEVAKAASTEPSSEDDGEVYNPRAEKWVSSSEGKAATRARNYKSLESVVGDFWIPEDL
jgi:hypothetical protein